MLIPQAPSFLLLILLVPFHALHPQSGYKVSDEYKSTYITEAHQYAYIDMGDGRHIVHGRFNSINGDTSGAIGLLDASGNFQLLIKKDPFMKTKTVQFARNSDGGYSLLILTDDSPAPAYHLIFTAEDELRTRKPLKEAPQVILPNSRFIRVSPHPNSSQQAPSQLIERGSFDLNGIWLSDTTFNGIQVSGFVANALPLIDGGLLLPGFYTKVDNTEGLSNIIRLDKNGTLVDGFQLRNLNWDLWTEYYPSQLPSGEIFLTPSSGNAILRLQTDGTPDPSFKLSSKITTTSNTRIYSAPDSGYYLLDVKFKRDGLPDAPIARIQNDGNIDPKFQIDPNGVFRDAPFAEPTISGFTANGDILVKAELTDWSYSFAYVTQTGETSYAAPTGIPGFSLAPTAHWTSNGELVFDSSPYAQYRRISPVPYGYHGIAKADGTIRAFLPANYARPLTALPDGTYLSQFFDTYASNGTELPSKKVFENKRLLCVFPDGTLLAKSKDTFTGKFTRVDRYTPSGSKVPNFRTLNIEGITIQSAHVSNDYIYYVNYLVEPVRDNQIVRYSLDGIRDEDFLISNISRAPTHIVDNGTHIYVTGNRSFGLERSFGARFLNNGDFDPSYAPESILKLETSNDYSYGNVIANDGSSLRFAKRIGTEKTELWYIDPNGSPEQISNGEWSYAHLSVASSGQAFVSGRYATENGSLNTSVIYEKQQPFYSVPQREWLSLSNDPVILAPTIINAKDGTYQWFKNDSPLVSENSSTLSFDSLTPKDAGHYHLELRQSETSVPIGPFKVREPKVATITKQPSDTGLKTSYYSEAVIDIQAEGYPHPLFQWYFKGLPISGETGPSIAISNAGLEDLGMYQVRTYNSLGECWSQPINGYAAGWWRTDQIEHDYRIALGFAGAKEDGSFYMQINGSSIGGVTTGQIARINANGTIDEAFNSSQSIHSSRDKRLIMQPIPGEGIAVTSAPNSLGYDKVTLLDSLGNIVWETLDKEDSTILDIILHKNDGLLLVEIDSESSITLSRCILETGELDPKFENGSYVAINSLETIRADSQGRIYVLSDKTPSKIERHNGDGTQDTTFRTTIPNESIRNFEIDAEDRVLILTNNQNAYRYTNLERIHPSGEVDSTFTPIIPYENQPNTLQVLENGNIYTTGLILSSNGETLEDLHRHLSWDEAPIMIGNKLIIRAKLPTDSFSNYHIYSNSGIPRIVVSPKSSNFSLGSDALLSTQVEHDGNLSYQWYKDNVALPSENKENLQLHSMRAQDAGNYAVRISWVNGSLRLPNFKISVSDQEPYSSTESLLEIQQQGSLMELSFQPNPTSPTRLLRSSNLINWTPIPHTSTYLDKTKVQFPPFHNDSPVFYKLELVSD